MAASGRRETVSRHARARGWYKGADLVAYCVFGMRVGKGKDLRRQPLERPLRRLLAEPRAGLLYADSVEDGAWLYGHALSPGWREW
jgi:bifunctional non-homologous end joining protein LigD